MSSDVCGGGLIEWLENYPQKDKIVVETWLERMPRQVVSKVMYRWYPEDLNSD